jgi:hypothetical protein
MVPQSPTTPQSNKSASADPPDLTKTQAGKTFQDITAKEDPGKPKIHHPKPSTARTVLLMVSVLLSTFLVALDKTIISTV